MGGCCKWMLQDEPVARNCYPSRTAGTGEENRRLRSAQLPSCAAGGPAEPAAVVLTQLLPVSHHPHSVTRSCDTLWCCVEEAEAAGRAGLLQDEVWDVCLTPDPSPALGETHKTHPGMWSVPGATVSHGAVGSPHPVMISCHFSPLHFSRGLFSRDLHNPPPRRQGQALLFRNILPGRVQLMGKGVALTSPAQGQGSTL